MASPDLDPATQTETNDYFFRLISQAEDTIHERNAMQAIIEAQPVNRDRVFEIARQRIPASEAFKAYPFADLGTLTLFARLGTFALAESEVTQHEATLSRIHNSWNTVMPLLNNTAVNLSSRAGSADAIVAHRITGAGERQIGCVASATGKISGLHADNSEFSIRIIPDRDTNIRNHTRGASAYIAKILDSASGERLVNLELGD